MLTKNRLREILAEGREIDDVAFVDELRNNMRRTIFLMAEILSEHQDDDYIRSTELQDRLIEDLNERGVPGLTHQSVI